MKKELLSAIFVIMASVMNISAQSKVHFLVKGGLNTSTITNLNGTWDNENVSKVESCRTSGLNVGLGMEWNPIKKIGIETGLYYSEYGTKYETEGLWAHKYDVKLYYIQIPVLAKYYVYKGLNVFAGPLISYRLEGESTFGFYNLYGEKFNYSAIAGLGYQFKFGLSLSANYMHGFTNLDPSYESYYILGDENGQTVVPTKYETKKTRISAFQFNIGWRF